jgi:hypothetical protein
MTYGDIYSTEGVQSITDRINKLTATTTAQWGKMNVAQMLAHLNVAYEMDHDDIHPRPNAIARFMLKAFVKGAVCGPKPYAKSTRTAPQFVISDTRDFNVEKGRLLAYIERTAAAGRAGYEGKENQSFGKLTADEWNTMYAKHLDHHLQQFGV